MNDSIKLEKALFKVLVDLEPYLNFLILVGGWVPFLYRNFLWKEEIKKPVYTRDIDFGFGLPKGMAPKKTVYGQLSSLRYLEKHLSMDRMFPVVPQIVISDKEAPLPIEFLTDESTPETLTNEFFGPQIKINRLEYFDMLLKSPITIQVRVDSRNINVQVPPPERFVVHKILTFGLRKNPAKRQKDAYYAYYVLRYHPKNEELVKKVRNLNLGEEGRRIKKILKRYFGTSSSAGILQVEREMGYPRSMKERREEIFEKFTILEKALN